MRSEGTCSAHEITEEKNGIAKPRRTQPSPRRQGETFIQIYKMHQSLFLSAPEDTRWCAALGGACFISAHTSLNQRRQFHPDDSLPEHLDRAA